MKKVLLLFFALLYIAPINADVGGGGYCPTGCSRGSYGGTANYMEVY